MSTLSRLLVHSASKAQSITLLATLEPRLFRNSTGNDDVRDRLETWAELTLESCSSFRSSRTPTSLQYTKISPSPAVGSANPLNFSVCEYTPREYYSGPLLPCLLNLTISSSKLTRAFVERRYVPLDLFYEGCTDSVAFPNPPAFSGESLF